MGNLLKTESSLNLDALENFHELSGKVKFFNHMERNSTPFNSPNDVMVD